MENTEAIAKQKAADKQLMTGAANEIRTLRQNNAIMGARLNMFDSMMSLFNNNPNGGNSSGMGFPDVLRELEMRVETWDAVDKM